ncbi:restriction endonuclease subunit S [Streptococcus thermophilus]|nr:restriction endonuclease subunit S [Streptococcus thermophilus]MCE2282042.1 restriction endonuclease subunit S [Streptococcus thermophilus]MCE2285455.1 restriction endonuclease subunit S [Streptococcus thermophilus]
MVDSFIPQIRFKMCKNQWEKIKLSKIAKFNPKSTLPEKFKYVDLESVLGTDLISYREVSRENAPSRAQRLAQKGDIFYQTVRPYQKNNYLFDSDEKDYVFSTGYAQLRPLIDSAFLLARLQEESFVNKVLERCTGTSYPAINSKDLSKISVTIPQTVEEQSAIGSLFRTLDDLLASYKDNLANYQSLKATMLFKMFPKAGHTVPEIRLDGFEGDWELLEINDLADDFQSGGTPKTNVQEYWNGDIPWIQSSDLEINCLFETKVQKSISEKGLKNSSAKIIPKDSIAVVTRVGVGKLAVMRHEYATSQDFLSFSNLKSNIEFTAYLLYRLLQKEVTQLQGTSIKGITKVELLSKKVLIPSLPEQQAIGAYFSNLDNLINSYQEKISQLETLKKKLLQDMFI